MRHDRPATLQLTSAPTTRACDTGLKPFICNILRTTPAFTRFYADTIVRPALNSMPSIFYRVSIKKNIRRKSDDRREGRLNKPETSRSTSQPKHTDATAPRCHSERSEGFAGFGRETRAGRLRAIFIVRHKPVVRSMPRPCRDVCDRMGYRLCRVPLAAAANSLMPVFRVIK